MTVIVEHGSPVTPQLPDRSCLIYDKKTKDFLRSMFMPAVEEAARHLRVMMEHLNNEGAFCAQTYRDAHSEADKTLTYAVISKLTSAYCPTATTYALGESTLSRVCDTEDVDVTHGQVVFHSGSTTECEDIADSCDTLFIFADNESPVVLVSSDDSGCNEDQPATHAIVVFALALDSCTYFTRECAVVRTYPLFDGYDGTVEDDVERLMAQEPTSERTLSGFLNGDDEFLSFDTNYEGWGLDSALINLLGARADAIYESLNECASEEHRSTGEERDAWLSSHVGRITNTVSSSEAISRILPLLPTGIATGQVECLTIDVSKRALAIVYKDRWDSSADTKTITYELE